MKPKRRRNSRRTPKPRIPCKEIFLLKDCGCCVYTEPNPNYEKEYLEYLEELKVFQAEGI